MYAEVYVYEQDINIDLFRTYINKQGWGLLLFFRRVVLFDLNNIPGH